MQTWAAACCSGPHTGANDFEGYDIYADNNGGPQQAQTFPGSGPNVYASVRKDHSGGFNSVFMDGHGKWMRQSKVENWAAHLHGVNWSWAD